LKSLDSLDKKDIQVWSLGDWVAGAFEEVVEEFEGFPSSEIIEGYLRF